MKIKLAVLCDYISLSSDNKLNLLGIFNEFRPRQLPTRINGFLVVVLELPRTADGKSLNVEAIGKDGQEIFRVTRAIGLTPPSLVNGAALVGEPVEFREVINLQGVNVSLADEYKIILAIEEGTERILLEALTFRIREPQVIIT